MSDLNCEWLVENFGGRNAVIFDIGCADLADSIRFRRFLPDARIYSFEPSPVHQKNNRTLAEEYDIFYHDMAISNRSGTAVFYPGNIDHEPMGLYTGTLVYRQNEPPTKWLSPVSVRTITYDDFCDQNNIKPDFVHIDVEGAEPDIFSVMSDKWSPSAIWAETSLKQPGLLETVLVSKGYHIAFEDAFDSLFVRRPQDFSPYKSFSFDDLDHDPGRMYPLECRTRMKEWLDSYGKIKDPSWPNISCVADFVNLPDHIKHECKQNFGFDIDPILLDGSPANA